MTVAELIEHLKTFPQNLPVMTEVCGLGCNRLYDLTPAAVYHNKDRVLRGGVLFIYAESRDRDEIADEEAVSPTVGKCPASGAAVNFYRPARNDEVGDKPRNKIAGCSYCDATFVVEGGKLPEHDIWWER